MTPDEITAMRLLLNDIGNEAVEVQVWEDDDYGIYLWGTHDAHSVEAQLAIGDFCEDSDYIEDVVMDALTRGGRNMWAHPIVVCMSDEIPRELVDDGPLPGWVPLIKGELP